MAIIAKNVSGSEVRFLGTVLAAGEEKNLIDFYSPHEIYVDEELEAYIVSEDVVINDGVNDLSVAEAQGLSSVGSLEIVSPLEAEEGTSSIPRYWTSERVAQAANKRIEEAAEVDASKVVQSDYIVGSTLNPETDEDDPADAVVVSEMTKTFSASSADNKIKVKFKSVFGGSENKKGKVKKDGARCAVFLDGTIQEETISASLADEEETLGTISTFWEGSMGDMDSHTLDIRMWCFDGNGVVAIENYRNFSFEEIDE